MAIKDLNEEIISVVLEFSLTDFIKSAIKSGRLVKDFEMESIESSINGNAFKIKFKNGERFNIIVDKMT